MASYGNFITPPNENKEEYPYAPVWSALSIEAGVLATSVFVLYVIISILKLATPTRLQPAFGFGLAISPLILWLLFSWFGERKASDPRRHLIAVVIVTMLAANSIGIPILDLFYRTTQWLPLAPAVNRILGYTLTAGIVQQLIKYIVMRYMVWPQNMRVRLDGVAYGIASGIGYATVLSLQFVTITPTAPPDIIAFHVFANYALHTATGILIGYGLSETCFSNPTPIFLSIILLISAVITGIAIPIRAGLVNTSLTISATSTPKSLLGLGFSFAVLVIVTLIVAGLIRNADRLEREAGAEIEE